MRGVELLWHRFLGVPYTLHVSRQTIIPKPNATLVFLHGIGNSGKTWDEVSAQIPDETNLVILDLLGFGDSPAPDWAVYDAKTQARSVAKTLLSIGVFGDVILVGHSMGGLVAVEFAKRYPRMVRSLVLCSPPLYNVDASDDKKLFAQRDEQLRRVYELALKNPQNIVRLSKLAKKYNLLNPDFDIDAMNIDSYVLALRANILNQTTTHDIVRIKKPIHIIYGTLDPFIIGQNIKTAASSSPHVTVTRFIGGHEIVGGYVTRVAKVIRAHVTGGQS